MPTLTPLTTCLSAFAISALLSSTAHAVIERPDLHVFSTASIATGNDDAEQMADGRVVLNGKDLLLGYSNGKRLVGLRYQLNLPKDAEITSAQLQFKAAAIGAGAAKVYFKVEDSANAAPFTTTTRSLGNRKVGKGISWQIPDWRSPGHRNADQLSVNISGLIAPIVKKSGWKSGNSIVVIAYTESGTGQRKATSFEAHPDIAPELIFSYKKPETVNRVVQILDRLAITKVKEAAADTKFSSWDNITGHAQSCDEYRMSRMLSMHVNELVESYRKSKNLAYMEEVDRLMQIVRGCLSDSNGDGFRNFVYKKAAGDATDYVHIGKDTHTMEEQLMHSFVAATALAYKETKEPKYAERVTFWTNYLKNDFVPKWQARTGGSKDNVGMPKYPLFHPYVNFTRFYYAMGQLTGDAKYTNEAKARAEKIIAHFRELPAGTSIGYGWSHSIEKRDGGCAPTPYVGIAVAGLQDLSHSGLIPKTVMQKVALNVGVNFVRSDLTLAANSCGRAPFIALKEMTRKDGTRYMGEVKYGGDPFTGDGTIGMIADEDTSGSLTAKMKSVENATVSKAGAARRAMAQLIGYKE